VIGWTLVGALVAGYLISHDGVQKIAAWAGEQLTIERLSLYITVGGGLLGAAAVLLVAARLWGRPGGWLIALYNVITLLLIGLIYNTMFMVDTEAIHFPQYALLGMLLLPRTGRVTEAITWVTLFGAFDEAWQYWVLNMGNRVDSVYFDFNDIVLNLAGGAFGVLLALALLADNVDAASDGYSWRDYVRSTAFRTTAAFVAAGGALWLAGRLTLFPDPSAWIVLARTGPRPAYWETSYWGKTTHVLLPLEGLPLIAALLALYLPLDRRLRLRLD
jgi:hypothetical protein